MRYHRRRPIVTYFLIALNIVTYLILAYMSGNIISIDSSVMGKYGFNKEAFLGGAYWQIITNMITHFDLPHLGYNMIFLAFFGSRSEEIFGRNRTLLFYILFGLVTTITSFLYPINSISAGSSGAIFGLLGADLIAQRGVYPNKTWSSLLYGLVFFFFAAATGFLSHLLGLIIGFVVGYISTFDWYREEEEEGNTFTPQ